MAFEEIPREMIEQAADVYGEESSYFKVLRIADMYEEYGVTPYFAAKIPDTPGPFNDKIYVLIRETQDKKRLH